MANGGESANRGFIFQAIIALIECLDPKNEWDQIKNEPVTKDEKVDIMLYKDGRPKSAIQVKSSINDFNKPAVERWLESLKADAEEAEKVCLCLVGDKFTSQCRAFIEEHRSEIKTVSFENLQRESTFQLIGYIKRAGLGEKVRVGNLDLLDARLFSEILRNSTIKEPVRRKDFEAIFRRAIYTEESKSVPQCLTPIPLIDRKIGLVGREEIVKEIRKMLDEDPCIVLVNGLGGIGKTAVMQGICSELKGEGYHVAWIRCGDSLRDDLLLLRDGLGISGEKKADEAYRLVIAGLKLLGKKLYLFMDDLSREVTREERDVINGLGIHVMFTSRVEKLPFPQKKLEVLDEENAVKMFYGYYNGKSENAEIARKIIGSVKSHTLLVELLAKAAKEEGGTLDAFYEKLEKDGFFNVSEEELEAEYRDENLTIEESVIKLYEILELPKEQQRIMKLFTIFSPEKEIYYKVRDWAGLNRKEMKKLVDRGWLERGGLEQGYFIHQIVRDSIAMQMQKNGEIVDLDEYGGFLDNIKKTNNYLGKGTTYQIVRERVVLTEDVARFFIKVKRQDTVAGILFNNIAQIFDQQSDFKKALEYFRIAIEINERVLGTNHPNLAVAYNNIAEVYREQGDYTNALYYYENALKIYERVFGASHPYIATLYNNMGLLLRAQGNYKRALDYYRKSLEISESVLGMGHRDTLATYSNMAETFRAQGDYENALLFHGKAITVGECTLGIDHPDTATLYNNAGMTYLELGNLSLALSCFKKSLDINEHVLGTNHFNTAVNYNDLAEVFRRQGNYEKALDNYRKALEIYEHVLEVGHPEMAVIYNNIALVLLAQDKNEKAIEYLKKALAIREHVFGTDHSDTAVTYGNIAAAFFNMGEIEKAHEYYGMALAIFERVLGPDHPNTGSAYLGIAGVFLNQGECKKAMEYCEKALTIFERVWGSDHPETKAAYALMGAVLFKQGNYVKALSFIAKLIGQDQSALMDSIPMEEVDYEKAISFIKKLLGPGLS